MIGISEDEPDTRSEGNLLADIGQVVPHLKYFSLGLISAWILLVATGDIAQGFTWQSLNTGNVIVFYLCSGLAHGTALVMSGVFYHKANTLIDNRYIVLISACASMLATLLVFFLGPISRQYLFVFGISCVTTGLCNTVVILRIGCVYGTLHGPKAFLVVAANGLLSNLIYFMCMIIDPIWSMIIAASLPFLAALLTFIDGTDRITDSPARQRQESPVPISSLPTGYFLRLLTVVLVFSLAAGVVKGFTTLLMPSESAVLSQTVSGVLGSFMVLLLATVIIVCVLARRSFDVSRVYYPVFVACCLTIVVLPLVTGSFSEILYPIVSAAYNVAIIIIWCFLTEVASCTTLGSVRVFGFGRGVSALATVAGWGISLLLVNAMESQEALRALFMVLTIACVIVLTMVFNEQTLPLAQKKIAPPDVSPIKKGETSDTGAIIQNLFDESCEKLATRYALTPREKDVLMYLVRGRSTGIIADELVISYNTAKGYIRNIYTKMDAHSRQEIIGIMEKMN